MTSGTEAVITLRPDVDDRVPSEVSLPQSVGDPASMSSFPKVLRRRLDKFFTDQKISPKADRAMWVKVAVGLAVLLGSWIAIYALKPDSWKFVALYLLGGLAQTFLLLNIAHDSNHNAISSVPSVNRLLNYVFDVCGIDSYMWRILHHRGHHSCINLQGEDDALTGRGIFRFTPHEPRARMHRFQHIYALFFYALFSLDYVFVRDFEAFFFPSHDYLKRTKHPPREYAILFAGKALYLTYMLILPVVVLGKSPLLVASGVRAGPFDHRLDRIAGIPDYAHCRQHLLSLRTAASLTMACITSLRPQPIMRLRTRSSVGSPAGSTTTSPIICAHIVCHTHYAPLTRIVKQTAEEFGVPYRQHPTMTRAILHHLILLKQLGNED